jgi:hypothetical protein
MHHTQRPKKVLNNNKNRHSECSQLGKKLFFESTSVVEIIIDHLKRFGGVNGPGFGVGDASAPI